MLRRSAVPTLLLLFFLLNLAYSQTPSISPTVVIRSVVFDNASELPDAPMRQVEGLLVGRSFKKSEIQTMSSMRVQDAFQQNGYYKAQIEGQEINSAGFDPEHEFVALTFHVQPGPQYRLRTLSIVNAKAFAPEQLRKLMPLQQGEIFNTATIRRGLENLRRFYGCEGYPDATVVPQERIDNLSRSISLTLDIDEGRRFLFRVVEVWGLNHRAASNLLNKLAGLGLAVGSVYSACTMDLVKQELRSGSRTVKVRTTLDKGMAQVSIDFTKDSDVPSRGKSERVNW